MILEPSCSERRTKTGVKINFHLEPRWCIPAGAASRYSEFAFHPEPSHAGVLLRTGPLLVSHGVRWQDAESHQPSAIQRLGTLVSALIASERSFPNAWTRGDSEVRDET